ncbi:MAG: sigma 54-interacting transcriptional regulator [Pseudomonadota bacterium]
MKPKIGFQTLVESHEQPFMVIDKHFRILALNQAYERAYATNVDQAIGKHCYEICHAHSRPCSEEGEECPHRQVYEKNMPHSCLHTHRDETGHTYWVRVTAFPIMADDGETYLGESIQELTQQDDPAETGETVHMVGESPAFLAMIEQLQLVAHSRVPVLLMGETGTGKELAANFIYQHSDRKDKPYVTVDCTNLSESLVESELFGHERGSFTGSVGMKQGMIELAEGGTLFLDEIGELPATMQAKLLRVLDTGEFRRVGGHKILSADVRVVCATNRHLWEAVKNHQFREDLYYRIACMTVYLPGLRERRQDIPLLADTLLSRLSRSTRRHYRLTDTALEILQNRNYPGNIRELRNYLYAASAGSADGWVDKPQLLKAFENAPKTVQLSTSAEDEANPGLSHNVADPAICVGDAESRRIAAVLKEQYGSRRRTAAALGISTRTLYRKMKRYGLR